MSRKRKNKLPKIGRKTVRSNFEYEVYKGIKNSIPKRTTVEYEVDSFRYTTTHDYIPDFSINLGGNKVIYIEAKGLGRAFDYASRNKMIAVKEQHPEADIRIVFMSDRPFRKGGKMRPSDWAKKYGFPFAIGEIPKEWFD